MRFDCFYLVVLSSGHGYGHVPYTDQAHVCYVGYIMDRYCIDRGTLLDNAAVRTLESPEMHSVHCLVDVDRCVNSAFEVLGACDESCANPEGLYCRAFRLDDAGKAAAIALARETGSCSTCTGAGSQRAGFRATVVGQVVDLNAAPPVLAVTSLLPESVGCGGTTPAEVGLRSEVNNFE